MDFDTLREFIEQSLGDNTRVQVTDLRGTGDHLGLLVVSNRFQGQPLLEQHKIVMDVLREKLKEEIHAVKIKTFTHEKAREKNIHL